MRRLIVTYRDILPERRGEYLVAWGVLRDHVVAAGGHAWVFHAESDGNRFIEFLEYRNPAIPELGEVREARSALDEKFPEYRRSTWVPVE